MKLAGFRMTIEKKLDMKNYLKHAPSSTIKKYQAYLNEIRSIEGPEQRKYPSSSTKPDQVYTNIYLLL